MVVVECPLCKEDVDLGRYELWQEGPEIFECPYCHEDFEWTSWDELERLDDLGRTEISNLKGAEFLRSITLNNTLCNKVCSGSEKINVIFQG